MIGLPLVHAEVKRCESLSLYKAFAQAEKDSAGTDDMPTVFHRKNGKQWLAVMSLEDWVKLYKGYIRQDQM